MGLFIFVKQKTAYEVRISDWSSDVCSSDLPRRAARRVIRPRRRDCCGSPRRLRARHPVRRRATDPRYRAASAARPVRVLRATDRKSVGWGKSVSVRVDLGGSRIMKKKERVKVTDWV